MTVKFKEPVAVPHKYRNRFLRDGGASTSVGVSSSSGSSVDMSAYLRVTDAANIYQPKGNYLASDGKAASASVADKLATKRTIWGKNFDGSGNIDGTISGVENIVLDDHYDCHDIGDSSVGVDNIFGHFYTSPYGVGIDISACDEVGTLVITTDQNVGIGNSEPQCKLDVNGNTKVNGTLRIGDAILSYDSTKKMLSLSDNSGDALNLVATGGMTSYGNEDEGVDGIKNFTVKDTLTIGDEDNDTSGIIKYYSASEGSFTTIQELQLVNNELFMIINGTTFKIGLTPV